jgi:prepilin-type N-terminal cleavage/methylation domain-containing protein
MNSCPSRISEVERVAPNALRDAQFQISGFKFQVFRRRRRRAFTLVEMLLALALLTGLLLSLNMFLFSMGELWGQNRQQRLFDQHVRAVTRYLDELLARGSLVAEAGHELRLAAPTGVSEPELTFDLAEGDRLLPWPGKPLPDVECALSAQSGRGLVLSWHSRWETGFKDTPPRTLVVSPLVRKLDYLYFDDGTRTWTATTSPPRDRGDTWRLPSRLRLQFQYERYTASAVVTIPPRLPALPAF